MMDAETLEALKASIAKWERNAVADTPKDFTTHWTNCALCLLFNNARDASANRGCHGCPVAEEGFRYCDGSPYEAAFRAKDRWETALLEKRTKAASLYREVARAAAVREVAFLKSLLPSEEPR